MTLSVLLDASDVSALLRYRPDAREGVLIAWDLGAHRALADRQLPHSTPWEIIHPAELSDFRAFDQRVGEFWTRHARIEYQNLNLLQLARYRHLSCFTRLAWIAFVVRRAIETKRIDQVICFDEAVGHGLEQPPGCSAMPLLQPMVRGIATQLGKQVCYVARDDSAFKDHAATNAQHDEEPVDLPDMLRNRPYLLLVGSDGDLLRQLPLIRALKQATDWPIVQLYRSASPTVRAALRAEGHIVLHETQVCADAADQAILDPSVAKRSSRARQQFDAQAHDAPNELQAIFANPHIASHFDVIFGPYAKRMAEHVARWQALFEQHPPALVMANYPTPAFDVAALHNIPGLVLPHGLLTIGDPRWHQCLPEVSIAARSNAHRDRLRRAGIASDRVAVTGDPGVRFMRAQTAPTRLSTDAGNRRILLITSAIAAPAHLADAPPVDWRGAIDTFDELNQLARRRTDWQFTIKPHPRYDQVELYEHLQKDLPPSRRWRIEYTKKLNELLPETDVAVVINNRSSTIVEASFLNKPVLLLCGDMVGIDLREWELHHWPRVLTSAELERELNQLFADPNHYTQRAKQSRDAAQAFLGDNGECDLNNIATNVLNLCNPKIAIS